MSDADEARERWIAKRMREMMGTDTDKGADSGPVDLKDDSYDAHIAENKHVVVDIWAAWCGPCKAVSPIIEQLARDYRGKVSFGKLDVDENPTTARKLEIMGIPTILFYKDGQLVDRIVGAAPRDHIEDTMRKAFQLT
jgi:thioredoxin 1